MSATRVNIPPHVRFGVTIQDNSWMDSVEQAYNSGYFYIDGPFVNDWDAMNNNVPLGAMYFLASGQVVVRLV